MLPASVAAQAFAEMAWLFENSYLEKKTSLWADKGRSSSISRVVIFIKGWGKMFYSSKSYWKASEVVIFSGNYGHVFCVEKPQKRMQLSAGGEKRRTLTRRNQYLAVLVSVEVCSWPLKSSAAFLESCCLKQRLDSAFSRDKIFSVPL